MSTLALLSEATWESVGEVLALAGIGLFVAIAIVVIVTFVWEAVSLTSSGKD